MSKKARLIDAEAILRDKVWLCGGYVSDDFSMGYMEALDKVETVIRQAPTVDAVPVVHGDWVDGRPYVNSRWKVCSVCHQSAPEPHGGYNYRPNCGAKMDLEVKDA